MMRIYKCPYRASVVVITLLVCCFTYVALFHKWNFSSNMLDIRSEHVHVKSIHGKDYSNQSTKLGNLKNKISNKMTRLKNRKMQPERLVRNNNKMEYLTKSKTYMYMGPSKYDVHNELRNRKEKTLPANQQFQVTSDVDTKRRNESDKTTPTEQRVPVRQVHTYTEAGRLLKDYVYEDIMSMKPIRFLPNFKNPCWLGRADNGPINDNTIHCLPYFFLIGVKKCGTSDLFARITRHPDVTSTFKEAQWFPRQRFMFNYPSSRLIKRGSDPRKLQSYIEMFDEATGRIVAATGNYGRNISEMITGDGTPANLHLQGVWDLLPGNKGLSEPRYTNLHYIKHLIPQAKIIIIFRNPTDRLYSDFLHHRGKSADVFHNKASAMVDLYTKCFQEHTFRHCIYNHNFTDVYPTTFVPAVGFYAFFMKELRSVFPEGQILPLLFEDHTDRPEETMAKVFKFLELRSLSSDQMQTLTRKRVRNSGAKRHTKTGPMLNITRTMLNEFYRSSNMEMARLMHDRRYLFSEE